MIIAFTGKKGSGKSTAAKALLTVDYKRVSFAEPLRVIVSLAFKIPMDVLTDPALKEQKYGAGHFVIDETSLNRVLTAASQFAYISKEQRTNVLEKAPRSVFSTPRQLLQYVGTEVFRECVDSDFWLKLFEAQTKAGHNYVCDDCRFPNEAEFINKLNGKIIRIERAGLESADTHPSENVDALPFDFKITNFDRDAFENDVKLIASTLLESASGTRVERQERT